jgi:hypothetical protein
MKLMTIVLSFALCSSVGWAKSDASCVALKKAKSKDSKTPIKMKFTNHTDGTVSLIWLGFAGDKKKYAEIEPRETWDQDTFLTHPWMITDAKGKCLGIYLPDPGKTEITIE